MFFLNFSQKKTCHSQTGGRGGSPTWEKFPHFPVFFLANVPKGHVGHLGFFVQSLLDTVPEHLDVVVVLRVQLCLGFPYQLPTLNAPVNNIFWGQNNFFVLYSTHRMEVGGL